MRMVDRAGRGEVRPARARHEMRIRFRPIGIAPCRNSEEQEDAEVHVAPSNNRVARLGVSQWHRRLENEIVGVTESREMELCK